MNEDPRAKPPKGYTIARDQERYCWFRKSYYNAASVVKGEAFGRREWAVADAWRDHDEHMERK